MFVLKINWIFPLTSSKLFMCMDTRIQYCKTIAKGTRLKTVNKFHSKQFCSKTTVSYSTHEIVCPLQHWTNSVCLCSDFSGAPCAHHCIQQRCQKSATLCSCQTESKGQETQRDKTFLEERSCQQMDRILEHVKCKAKTRNTQASTNTC